MSAGKILIAEDDVLISQLLKEILVSMDYEVMGIVGSFTKAQEFIAQGNLPELALLDIRMHNEDQGVQIAELMNQHDVPFIFITSFADKNTLQAAVAQQPLGYILKPFKPSEIQEAVNNAFANMEPRFLVIRNRSEVHHISVEDIMYLESENVYVNIHTVSGKLVHRIKLGELLDSLPEQSFVRIHQSFAIHRDHVEKLTTNHVVIGGREIPISRSYKGELKELQR